jgi:thymidylate kinase
MRRYAARDPRTVIVDANGPVEVVERAIAEEVRRVVGRERA